MMHGNLDKMMQGAQKVDRTGYGASTVTTGQVPTEYTGIVPSESYEWPPRTGGYKPLDQQIIDELNKTFENNPVKADEGRKDDSDKLRMDLIPPEAMEALAVILGFGARKYAERNWEKGMKWSRVFGASMRHLWSWFKNENNGKDPETGYSHLWHALCCVAFLVAYESRKAGTDDRPIIPYNLED